MVVPRGCGEFIPDFMLEVEPAGRKGGWWAGDGALDVVLE